jgi:hypothetical protein
VCYGRLFLKMCAIPRTVVSSRSSPSSLPVFPETGFRRINGHMFPGVRVATSIGQPHIVASICQNEPCGTEGVPVRRRTAVAVCAVRMSVEHYWKATDRQDRSTPRKSCPNATLSTTNLTWTDLGSNPGLRGERPAPFSLHVSCELQVSQLYFFETNSVKLNVAATRSKQFKHVPDV